MSKREYTHVRLLYPEIKAMIEAGKTQREIAEYYGFKHKYVVKGKLEDWEQKLNQIRFCKSHTSFLVNLDYVSRFTKNEIVLAKGKYTAHVSRRMYVKFCKMYEEYLRRG